MTNRKPVLENSSAIGVQFDGSALHEQIYNEMYEYMRNQGYPVAIRQKLYFSTGTVNDKWNDIKSIIQNDNVPINLAYMDGGIALHVVLVVGCQYLGTNYLLVSADPYFESIVYKVSAHMTSWTNGYSTYMGWRT